MYFGVMRKGSEFGIYIFCFFSFSILFQILSPSSGGASNRSQTTTDRDFSVLNRQPITADGSCVEEGLPTGGTVFERVGSGTVIRAFFYVGFRM